MTKSLTDRFVEQASQTDKLSSITLDDLEYLLSRVHNTYLRWRESIMYRNLPCIIEYFYNDYKTCHALFVKNCEGLSDKDMIMQIYDDILLRIKTEFA